MPWTKAQALRYGGLGVVMVSAPVLLFSLGRVLGDSWMRVLFQGFGGTLATGGCVLLVFMLERRATANDQSIERSAKATSDVLDAIRAYQDAITAPEESGTEDELGAAVGTAANQLLHRINRAASTDAARSRDMLEWWLDAGRAFAEEFRGASAAEDVVEMIYQGAMNWMQVNFDGRRIVGPLQSLDPKRDPVGREAEILAKPAARKKR